MCVGNRIGAPFMFSGQDLTVIIVCITHSSTIGNPLTAWLTAQKLRN